MQIVNGYICMNCCDVDKARLGQDPHQSADQLKKQIERHLDKLAAGNFGPAVTLGGSLQRADSGDDATSDNDNGGDTGGGTGGGSASQAASNGGGIATPANLNVIV